MDIDRPKLDTISCYLNSRTQVTCVAYDMPLTRVRQLPSPSKNPTQGIEKGGNCSREEGQIKNAFTDTLPTTCLSFILTVVSIDLFRSQIAHFRTIEYIGIIYCDLLVTS